MPRTKNVLLLTEGLISLAPVYNRVQYWSSLYFTSESSDCCPPRALHLLHAGSQREIFFVLIYKKTTKRTAFCLTYSARASTFSRLGSGSCAREEVSFRCQSVMLNITMFKTPRVSSRFSMVELAETKEESFSALRSRIWYGSSRRRKSEPFFLPVSEPSSSPGRACRMVSRSCSHSSSGSPANAPIMNDINTRAIYISLQAEISPYYGGSPR